MLIFQIIATLFIVFAVQRIVSRYHQSRIPKSEIYIWLVFWAVIAFAIWWPHGTDLLAQALGISRGYELIVASSLALIFYLLFKLFSDVHQLKRELTELVRELALKEEDTGGGDNGI